MKLLFVLFLSTLSLSALAGKGDKSMGFCGLGDQVAPKMSMVSLTTRATTNSFTGPFGTTTGTSGCARHSIVLKKFIHQHFAALNFDELVTEMAMGQGENLVAFSRAMGCNDGQTQKFSNSLKSNFSVIGQSKGPQELVLSVSEVIAADNELARSCII